MRTLRITMILLLCCLYAKPVVAQDSIPIVVGEDHPLYRLEARLMNGDKSALFEIAHYFDSEKRIVEYLGHHRLETTESSIAKRMVVENTLFTDEEFSITKSS